MRTIHVVLPRRRRDPVQIAAPGVDPRQLEYRSNRRRVDRRVDRRRRVPRVVEDASVGAGEDPAQEPDAAREKQCRHVVEVRRGDRRQKVVAREQRFDESLRGAGCNDDGRVRDEEVASAGPRGDDAAPPPTKKRKGGKGVAAKLM